MIEKEYEREEAEKEKRAVEEKNCSEIFVLERNLIKEDTKHTMEVCQFC